jgi:hypothetical protein
VQCGNGDLLAQPHQPEIEQADCALSTSTVR